MSELSELLSINKKTAKSFHQQKKLIADLMKGKQVNCTHCQQPLAMSKNEDENVVISCKQQCTNILLELA